MNHGQSESLHMRYATTQLELELELELNWNSRPDSTITAHGAAARRAPRRAVTRQRSRTAYPNALSYMSPASYNERYRFPAVPGVCHVEIGLEA